jgi:hypothetical protein
MRRAQSVRNAPRPSGMLVTDDLGVLKEADESAEDGLRRQLLEKDRENDKVLCMVLSVDKLYLYSLSHS